MGNLSITFGTAFSFLLGTFWILAVVLPWNWLRSDNAIVSFQVNLFNVYTSQGLGTAVLSGVSKLIFGNKDKFGAALTAFMDQTMTIQDAKSTFCVISIFNWCDQWEKAWMASWIMTILGGTAGGLFIAGGCCLYFYGNVHATETGRCMSKFFLCMGPLCGLSGILAYSFLTMEFGKSSDPIMNTGSHSYWGTGWIVAVSVTVLSWVPVYILFAFCRADPLEKKHGVGEDDYLEYGGDVQQGNPGYGAAGYGTQAQPYPQQGAGGYGAQAQPYPQQAAPQAAPGFGLPASNAQAPMVVMQQGPPAAAPGYGAPAW